MSNTWNKIIFMCDYFLPISACLDSDTYLNKNNSISALWGHNVSISKKKELIFWGFLCSKILDEKLKNGGLSYLVVKKLKFERQICILY